MPEASSTVVVGCASKRGATSAIRPALMPMSMTPSRPASGSMTRPPEITASNMATTLVVTASANPDGSGRCRSAPAKVPRPLLPNGVKG